MRWFFFRIGLFYGKSSQKSLSKLLGTNGQNRLNLKTIPCLLNSDNLRISQLLISVVIQLRICRKIIRFCVAWVILFLVWSWDHSTVLFGERGYEFTAKYKIIKTNIQTLKGIYSKVQKVSQVKFKKFSFYILVIVRYSWHIFPESVTRVRIRDLKLRTDNKTSWNFFSIRSTW